MELLRQVVEDVQEGTTRFVPASQSQEDLVAFQPLAAALRRADELGYFSAKFRVSEMRDTPGYILEAVITSPLTHEGHQYLAKGPTDHLEGPHHRRTTILQLNPNIYGLGIDLRAAYQWLKRKVIK